MGLTPERLKEIEKRAKDATEGPWFVERDGIYNAQRSYLVLPVGDSNRDRIDALFIACARSDIPALVAALREEREISGRYRDALTGLVTFLTEGGNGEGWTAEQFLTPAIEALAAGVVSSTQPEAAKETP